ncbi:hypothetical protein RCL1_001652 [Eukaryota sp. TZLM3-RCL]
MTSDDSHIKVVVRIRPTSTFAHSNILLDTSNQQAISIHLPRDFQYGPQNQKQTFDFNFDSVLLEASQQDVYQQTTAPLIEPLLNGFNGTVFCYGQTGTGKTYSIVGPQNNFQARGIIPRTLSQLYKSISQYTDIACTVRIGFLEIYQDSLVDLLSDLPLDSLTSESCYPSLNIQEDAEGIISVSGQRLAIAESEEVALALLFEGETNRSVASHILNKCSSRAHAIFTIQVESRTKYESPEVVTTAKLHLVDLAGSERVKKTGATGNTMEEARFINKSLSFLEQVIIALDKSRNHVPFRQSKLCLLLKDSLGGNCKTSMIATISGESEHLEETISTLRFGARVKRLKTSLVKNAIIDPKAKIKALEHENKLLRQELALYDSINKTSVSTVAVGDVKMKERAQEIARLFINDEISDLDFQSVTFINELLIAFKKEIKSRDSTINQLKNESMIRTRPSSRPLSTTSFKESEETEEVIDEEPSPKQGLSFAVGRELPPQAFDRSGLVSQQKSHIDTSTHVSLSNLVTLRGVEGAKSKQDAFEEFKVGPGSALNSSLLGFKSQLKQKNVHAKLMAEKLNEAKNLIDTLRGELPASLLTSEDQEVTITPEDHRKLEELEKAKVTYRSVFDLFRGVNTEIKALQVNIDAIRSKLLHDFEAWYLKTFNPPSTLVSGKAEVMDESEVFELMEEQRLMREDPDSLSYHRARRTVEKNLLKATL